MLNLVLNRLTDFKDLQSVTNLDHFNFFMTEVTSYRNQSIDLLYKSLDWFLHDRHFYHERVKPMLPLYTAENIRKPRVFLYFQYM